MMVLRTRQNKRKNKRNQGGPCQSEVDDGAGRKKIVKPKNKGKAKAIDLTDAGVLKKPATGLANLVEETLEQASGELRQQEGIVNWAD